MSAETESSMATRPSVLARLKDWSQQTAWRDFDHDYAPLLRNLALKAGLTDAEAKDVVQETLIAVAKKIGEFQHAGNRGAFRAWLYQQARWRITDQFRARVRAVRSPHQPISPGNAGEESSKSNLGDTVTVSLNDAHLAETPPLADSAFERLWDDEWTEHFWQSALARVKRKVSPWQFQLFDLHVLQGLSVSASAKAAGTTIAAVYMAKSRVGRILKREVKEMKPR